MKTNPRIFDLITDWNTLYLKIGSFGESMKAIYVGLLVCLVSANAMAQELASIESANKMDAQINLDGQVNEPVWNSLSALPLTMHWPSYYGELTEETQIKIFYDDEYIYIGAICFDSEPDKIQEISYQRDSISEQADAIAFVLDPYDDNENVVVFSVTATGARADFSLKNDAQGGDTWNISWNSYWDAEVSRMENGWQAEVRIPFSSLRFQDVDGKVQMGVGAYRYIARKREMQVYPEIPPDWGFWSFAKPSMMQTTEFENVENKRPWYTSPYILGGIGHNHEYDDNDNPEKINDNDIQIGLDVQHAFSDNLNADFTLNTDFAQVEADDQAVNLSRFSLFFPEKRRFFLERASTFDFKADGNNNLFYSRRIGINDGELVPMLGGARLVGRVSDWDVGFINLQSRKTGSIAAENFGVLRLRRNVLNQRSYVGAMVTSRINSEGEDNYAYGFDGIINVFGEDYLQINVAQSQDSEDPANLDPIDRSRIFLRWENRQSRGFGYSMSYSNVGEEYNPGLGFERRFNFSQYSAEVGYIWFLAEERNLRTIEIGTEGSLSTSNATNKLETNEIEVGLSLGWDRGNALAFEFKRELDRVPEAFDLSDNIEIVQDEYINTEYVISYSTAPVGLLLANMSAQAGKFYGGNMVSFSFGPEFVASKYVQFAGSYQYSNIEFKDLGETFVSHLARLKTTVSFNVKWSMSSIAQVNSLAEISALNFRLRYNPVDGNDFFLVYNEVINNNPNSITPNLPLSENRAILVKYVHTFRL